MKKLLSLLATVSLVSTTTASVVACGGENNQFDDDTSNIDDLRNSLFERLSEAVTDHLNVYMTSNSIIDPNDENLDALNMSGIQSLSPIENEHPTREMSPTEIESLNSDVNKIINFAALQTRLQNIVNESQFNVITQGLTGNALEAISLDISGGFASAAEIHTGAAFVNWLNVENALINEAFVGNFSVNFSLTVRYTATDSFTVNSNLTTVTTNNIYLGAALQRYITGGSVLGSRADAAQIFISSSRDVIEDRSSDETYIANSITNSLTQTGANLGDIIVDEFFDNLTIGAAGFDLTVSKTEPTENIVGSLTWTNEFFRNHRINTPNWDIPSGQFTREGLESIHSSTGLFQAINLIWGVDMGTYNQPTGIIPVAARAEIIESYIEFFNSAQNDAITTSVNNFVENYTGFESNANALVKIGHGVLNNLRLEITADSQVLLPAIQIPLALTINNENRLSEAVSQAYAENIRRALAVIQYYYSIDTSLYQEGAISLFGGFHRETMQIGANSWNFWNVNIFNARSANAQGGVNTFGVRNFESRFNLQGGVNMNNGNALNPPHWSAQVRPLIQNRINQTGGFRHSFGTNQNTFVEFQQQTFGGIQGFNLMWIHPTISVNYLRLTYRLDLDYFGVNLGTNMTANVRNDFNSNTRNFVFTRLPQG